MAEPATTPAFGTVRRVGITAWTVIGVFVVFAIGLGMLAAISELVLPLIFAVMVGAVARPLALRLQRWGLRPAAAAAAVVLGAVAAVGGIAVLVVRNVVRQTGDIAHQFDLALGEVSGTTDAVGLGAAQLEAMRAAIASVAAIIGRGLVTLLVGGLNAVFGLVAGVVLGVLIAYYMLKDGPVIESWAVEQFPPAARSEVDDFLRTGITAIRSYWAGRTVLSAVVAAVIGGVSLVMGLPLVGAIVVVNFLGGYVPYLGAFLGGGLATLIATAHGGLKQGIVMLLIVFACNLLLENLLEPKVMSTRLRIHPLVVLLATTVGGIVGGMVGLILAVPVAVLAIDLVRRLKAAGIAERLPLKVNRPAALGDAD